MKGATLKDKEYLGTENVTKLIIKMGTPMFFGILAFSLYNVVDALFLGQAVGPNAIAALTIAFPVQMILGALAQGVGTGAGSILSRALGAKDLEKAKTASGNAISFMFMISFGSSVLILIFLESFLSVIGTSNTLMPYAKSYLWIIALGLPFSMIGQIFGMVVRAEGLAKEASIGMISGVLLNILLDPIFIFWFDMGIEGAAIATIISQFVAFFYILLILKKTIIEFKTKYLTPHMEIIKEMMLLGSVPFLQNVGASFIIGIFNNILKHYGDDSSIAVYGIFFRILIFALVAPIAITIGMQAIIGYNYGAKNWQRVKDTLKSALLLGFLSSFIIYVFIIMFPEVFVRIFTQDPQMLEDAPKYMRIGSIALPVISIQMVGSSYFLAVGKKWKSLFTTLLRQYIALLPLLFILPPIFKLNGAWASIPLADTISTIVAAVLLYREVKKLGKRV